MGQNRAVAVILLALACSSTVAGGQDASPPSGFTYLRALAPTIVQDIRYAGTHNFIGRPIAGYGAAECVLTQRAAHALAAAQAALAKRNLSLIVWDCYRPMRAVADFLGWSKDSGDTRMKAEFYPRTDKTRLFALGYIAARSAHSRGSTVDLGLAPLALTTLPPYDLSAPLRACTSPWHTRFDDGAIDLGTGFDCLDPAASTSTLSVGATAVENRRLLSDVMLQADFKPYAREWWHFQLIDEPYPSGSFDVPIVPSDDSH